MLLLSKIGKIWAPNMFPANAILGDGAGPYDSPQDWCSS